MNSITLKANAKINLSLNVTGVSQNMHTLDMVLASVNFGDVVNIEKNNSSTSKIKYSDSRITVGTDTVTKAVQLFNDEFRAQHNSNVTVDIFIDKKIPLASGLGGSGVDAAAVLVGLQKLYNTNYNLQDLAKQIGSDVSYQLKGGFARVEGIGDKITNFASDAELFLVIAMGQTGVLAKDAYASFDQIYPSKEKSVSDNDELIKQLSTSTSISDYKHFANALTKPAIYLNSTITDTLIALQESNAEHVLMSGSGSACIGFYKSKDLAKDAAKKITDSGLFAIATSTVKYGIVDYTNGDRYILSV